MPTLVHPALALVLLVTAQFIIAADYNIVYVALPSIGDALGFSAHTLQWVISSYALAFGGFLLLGGRLGDVIGRRRAFVIALLLYAGSSFSGGFAATPAMLVGSRAIQGLGGALLLPTTLSLLSTYYAEGPVRNRALGWLGAAGASGGALGALLGGVLTSSLGWSWTFFVNIPVAAAASIAAIMLLPADAPRIPGTRVDVPGALTATAGVTLLVLACVQGPEIGWATIEVVGLLIGAVALLASFVVIEGRTTAPLMPLRLFRHPTLPAALGVTALFMSAFGAQYLPADDLPSGGSPLSSDNGRHGIPAILSVGCPRHPRRQSLGGSHGPASRDASRDRTWNPRTVGRELRLVQRWVIRLTHAAWIFLDGLGQGITWTLMWIAATSGIEPRDRGIGSGMASTAQWVGSALGLALLVAVATKYEHGNALHDAEILAGLRAAFVTAAAVASLAGVVVVCFIGRTGEGANEHYSIRALLK